LQASVMALSTDAVNKQLDNMVSFILKEGQEKAEEIKHQGEMDFTVEKMRLVNDARVKIRTEYEKKAKKAEVDKKMYASIVAREAATVEAGRASLPIRQRLVSFLQCSLWSDR
jgi:V-type H+-transporting ATPase subunit E